ncbi:hypothetical protein AAC387_Pa02g1518 [Persea americana]
MPAQKRSRGEEEEDEEEYEEDCLSAQQQQKLQHEQEPDADSEGSPSSSGDKETEFVVVKLSEIRKEVQCPICLGIIRKTRTVMECLHRFCRECIDKSMRLGNNECPACRTHCASRRSLRDDPNYDALISALYPDIDKYEEEELAFHEEEKARNKQIQASIAQTFRRQSEALGRRRTSAKATAAAAFMRKPPGSFRNSGYLRRRNRHSRESGHAGSDEDEEDVNGEGGKDAFPDEPSTDVRQKRYKRWPGSRFSPALAAGSNADGSYDEADDTEVGRESTSASPGRAGTPEVLVWGKGGTRSHTRYGSLSGSNGKHARSSRVSKLADYFRNMDEHEEEFDIQVTLLPFDEKIKGLPRPYLCCRPTLSIRHLCQFISLQISIQAEDLEILVKDSRHTTAPECGSVVNTSTSMNDMIPNSEYSAIKEEEPQILGAEDTLAGLHANCASSRGNLVLVYRSKSLKS